MQILTNVRLMLCVRHLANALILLEITRAVVHKDTLRMMLTNAQVRNTFYEQFKV